MGISAYKSMTKQELALSQLNVAVRLYLQDEEYPAAITLAGAAEEILGKLAMSMGHVPSFKRKVRDLCEMFQAIWGREANEKDFADLRNRARNELKHIGNGDPITLDFEREAVALLTRAFENHILVIGSPHPLQHAFSKKRVENWRAKQPAA